MKTLRWFGWVCLGFLITANVTLAQPPEYKYLGGWGDGAALIVADAFVLNDDKTDKLVGIHSDVAASHREGFGGWQDMSDDERQKMFAEYRKNVATDMKNECGDLLSESELNEIEAIMSASSFSIDAEVRALRFMDELSEENRSALQSVAIAVVKNLVPPEFGFFAPQISDDERSKAEAEFKKAKDAFTAKAKEVLSAEQQENWGAVTEEIKKELEDRTERMRQFQNN